MWSSPLCALGKPLFTGGWEVGAGRGAEANRLHFRRSPNPPSLSFAQCQSCAHHLLAPFSFLLSGSAPGLTWKGHGQKMVIPAPELYTRANLALGKFWGLCTPLEKSNGQEKYMKTLHGGEKVDAGQVG